MIDRDKIISAIEKAKKQSEEYAQDRIIVPFREADMILALLKEQPELVRCKDCRWYDEKISFCDNCHLPREQTFFCADGKRR